MTLEADLQATLGPLVAGRAFPDAFPQAPLPLWPAIRHTIISNVSFKDLCGDDPPTANIRVQLDLVAETYKTMRALRSQVMTVMRVFDPPAIEDGNFVTFDEATKTHRCVVDYWLMPSSSSP